MSRIKIISISIIILVLISLSYAEDEDDEENYDNPEWVNNNLDTADYSQIPDWSLIDYARIPQGRYSDIPYDNPNLNYNELNYDYVDYDKVDYNRINYDKVNHEKVDPNKYLAAKGCNGCSFNKNGIKIKYSENKITHPNGNSVSIPGNYPDNSIWIATSERIEVYPPQGIGILVIRGNDIVTVVTGDTPIILDDGTIASGSISFDKGKKLIAPGDVATINSYAIDNTVSQNPLTLSINKFSNDKNSISFKNDVVVARGTDFSVTSPYSIVFDFYGIEGQVTMQGRFRPDVFLRKDNVKNDDSDVMLLQEILNKKGYTDEKGKPLTVDGIFGKNTEYALTKYQQELIKQELLTGTGQQQADGILGLNTINAMNNDLGPDVRVIGSANFPLNNIYIADGKVVGEALPGLDPIGAPMSLNVDGEYIVEVTPVKQEIKEITKKTTPVLVKTPAVTVLKNPKTTDLKKDDDLTAVARLIFGEARGGSDELKKAVAYTVLNRVNANQWWGSTPKEVAYKPWQYSTFNKGDPNRAKVMDPVRYESLNVWKSSYSAAQEVMANPNKDITNGATHYYDTSISTPFWAKGETPVKIIRYRNKEVRFYKLKR